MALLGEGTVVGNYRIEKLLGRGGMGVVYQALDLRLGRRVALKLLSAELAQDVLFRQRFLRESRTAASIDHPNVLPVYEAAEADGDLFIAMRLVEGEDLTGLLSREGALDPVRAARLIAQVADALDAVHVHGLIHRDIKPSNILIHTLGAREHAYVTDFGITKASTEGTTLTKTGVFVGTVEYCAPEVIRGDVLDGRADVYSLGCVLFECLTGEKPFSRDSDLAVIYAHLEDPPPVPRDRRPELPAALDAVVARAMAKERDQRFASAGELADAALAAVGVTPDSTPSAPSTGRRPRTATLRERAGRRGLAVAGALLVLVAGVAIAAVVTGGGDSGGADSQTDPPNLESDELTDRTPASEGRSIVGSDLAQVPGEAGYCSGGGSGDAACTVAQTKLGTADQAVRADGVITSWSVRGGKGPLALRVLDGPAGRRRVVAEGPAVRPTGSGVEKFSVRIPVLKGQYVGVELGTTGFLPFRYRDETTRADFYQPPLGSSPTTLKPDGGEQSEYEHLYNATIEPDDDGDGRGDLTQDPDHGGAGARCPSSGVLARGAGSSVIRRGERLFGCRGGVQTPVGTSAGGARSRLFRFAGDQLALVRVANGESSIRFFDLGDQRNTFSTTQTYADDRPADWTVTDLVVAPSGNAAWMAVPRDAPDRAAVWTRSGRKVEMVDGGRLKPGSLRLGVDEGDADVTYEDQDGRTRETGF